MRRTSDLTGMTFGRLTAKEIVRYETRKGAIWRCECSCGGEKEVLTAYLINGKTKSCGCLAERDIEDAVKQRRLAEERLHDPEIIERFEDLTEERKAEFLAYLQGTPGETRKDKTMYIHYSELYRSKRRLRLHEPPRLRRRE